MCICSIQTHLLVNGGFWFANLTLDVLSRLFVKFEHETGSIPGTDVVPRVHEYMLLCWGSAHSERAIMWTGGKTMSERLFEPLSGPIRSIVQLWDYLSCLYLRAGLHLHHHLQLNMQEAERRHSDQTSLSRHNRCAFLKVSITFFVCVCVCPSSHFAEDHCKVGRTWAAQIWICMRFVDYERERGSDSKPGSVGPRRGQHGPAHTVHTALKRVNRILSVISKRSQFQTVEQPGYLPTANNTFLNRLTTTTSCGWRCEQL